MMSRLDPTADDISLFVTEKVAAAMLGRGIDWFRKNIDNLEAQHAFPRRDTAVGLRPKAAILEWQRRRWEPNITGTGRTRAILPLPQHQDELEDWSAFQN